MIACVNGFAFGGGCEIVMSCDFIYATNSVVFGQPEVKLGLIPGFGGMQRLSCYIGRNRVCEIVYMGRNMKAEEAYRVGLAVWVFENKEDMIKGVFGVFSMMSKVSFFAIETAKKVMNEGNDLIVE